MFSLLTVREHVRYTGAVLYRLHARPDRATIPPYRCCGEPDAHADARDATRHTPRRARGETVYAVYHRVADTAHRCAFVSLSETVGGTLTSHVIS